MPRNVAKNKIKNVGEALKLSFKEKSKSGKCEKVRYGDQKVEAKRSIST